MYIYFSNIETLTPMRRMCKEVVHYTTIE